MQKINMPPIWAKRAKLEPVGVRVHTELEKLPRSLQEALKKIIEGIPDKFKMQLLKSYTRKASYRVAIKSKCMECVNFEEVSSRIRECTVIRCPLHKYRPYQ